ncbi:hypothetical protein AB0M28_15205 [Streptomyces sp. NPDC051940]|uniref:hypothetical protein n=1 Tax=Streptomyces sp. NPDC051940 TaxID=3155675 RepID=UPI0034473B26
MRHGFAEDDTAADDRGEPVVVLDRSAQLPERHRAPLVLRVLRWEFGTLATGLVVQGAVGAILAEREATAYNGERLIVGAAGFGATVWFFVVGAVVTYRRTRRAYWTALVVGVVAMLGGTLAMTSRITCLPQNPHTGLQQVLFGVCYIAMLRDRRVREWFRGT